MHQAGLEVEAVVHGGADNSGRREAIEVFLHEKQKLRKIVRQVLNQDLPSSTSRTLFARSGNENGFWMKFSPSSSTPYGEIASAVYPDIKRHLR